MIMARFEKSERS